MRNYLRVNHRNNNKPNPFSNVQDENRTILKLVYRSLLQYNPENGNFVKDLASCDIKNLKNIECFIEE